MFGSHSHLNDGTIRQAFPKGSFRKTVWCFPVLTDGRVAGSKKNRNRNIIYTVHTTMALTCKPSNSAAYLH